MTRSRKILLAVVAGLVGGLLVGWLYATLNPDRPMLVVLPVFSLVLAPSIGMLLWILWLDRANVEAEAARHQHDVERRWWERASSAAFSCTLAILVLLEVFGGMLHLGWASPVGLLHVLVVGFGALAVSYALIRRQGS